MVEEDQEEVVELVVIGVEVVVEEEVVEALNCLKEYLEKASLKIGFSTIITSYSDESLQEPVDLRDFLS